MSCGAERHHDMHHVKGPRIRQIVRGPSISQRTPVFAEVDLLELEAPEQRRIYLLWSLMQVPGRTARSCSTSNYPGTLEVSSPRGRSVSLDSRQSLLWVISGHGGASA